MQSVYTIDGNDFSKYDHELDWSGRLFEQYEEIAPIKNHSGIYAFTICEEIVYIGSSTNLFNRLQTHIGHMHGKTNQYSSSMESKKYYYESYNKDSISSETTCWKALLDYIINSKNNV